MVDESVQLKKWDSMFVASTHCGSRGRRSVQAGLS